MSMSVSPIQKANLPKDLVPLRTQTQTRRVRGMDKVWKVIESTIKVSYSESEDRHVIHTFLDTIIHGVHRGAAKVRDDWAIEIEGWGNERLPLQ